MRSECDAPSSGRHTWPTMRSPSERYVTLSTTMPCPRARTSSVSHVGVKFAPHGDACSEASAEADIDVSRASMPRFGVSAAASGFSSAASRAADAGDIAEHAVIAPHPSHRLQCPIAGPTNAGPVPRKLERSRRYGKCNVLVDDLWRNGEATKASRPHHHHPERGQDNESPMGSCCGVLRPVDARIRSLPCHEWLHSPATRGGAGGGRLSARHRPSDSVRETSRNPRCKPAALSSFKRAVLA